MATEPPLNRAAQLRVLVPFTIVTLIWGGTWLVIRHQLGIVPPSWSIAYRFALAAAAMFLYARFAGASLRLAARDHAFAAVTGVALFGLNFQFVYRAEGHIASGLVALVFAMLIVPNTLLARAFLGQGVSRRFFAGSAVAVGGLALLFWHELSASAAGPRATLLGIGLTLAGVMAASVANVMQASERARRLPVPTLLAWGMAYGALADAAFAWITAGPPRFDPSLSYVVGLAYLGLAASAVAFPLYFGVIQAIGPGRAAYSSVLVPVLAMALSTVFEAYRWTVPAALGVALVLAGLVIALRAKASGQARPVSDDR
ncbi:DMT family transporter [Sphingomonas solaris]|uniref:DMT family transporter n=1 Tax=Alterirhizorhabdus solaris TaxID=2529389 RepID=A0A558QX81_9SPHN|nr:DMT family transporter [Sphingomonas solaris]